MRTEPIDLVIIVFFLVGITLMGILQMRKSRKTSDIFFLAGRDLKWPLIALSLVRHTNKLYNRKIKI